MVQPVQLKAQDSYQEMREQQEEIDDSWTLENLAEQILEDPTITQKLDDELTLASLVHEKYKEQHIENSETAKGHKTDETYLNFQEFYQNLKNSLKPNREYQIDQIQKINQLRDMILLGEMQYKLRNDTISAQIKDAYGETQIRYEGPSKPSQIDN